MNEVDIPGLTQQVLWAFFALSFVVGFISQRTHFCTMGAIADVINMGDWTRARQWMVALGIVTIGFAAMVSFGQMDGSKTLYFSNRLLWLSCLVGGLMFGYGMVIASGCGNKMLVRIGGGNLKSIVVFLVLGISAFATLKGITAVLRVNTVDAVALDMPQGANLPGLLVSVGLASSEVMGSIGFVIGVVLLIAALRHRDFWTLDNLVAGFGVGLVMVGLWWVSGHLGFVSEHPDTLEPVYLGTNSGRIEALTFVAPIAHTLDWLMFFSDKSKVLTAGVVSVLGVVAGSFVCSIVQGSFRVEGFADRNDLAQHLLGALLMGVGGVTGLGCTFGQGLSGLSTLSLNALITVGAIVCGAVWALRHQIARLERELAE